jgi:hypothetical protein
MLKNIRIYQRNQTILARTSQNCKNLKLKFPISLGGRNLHSLLNLLFLNKFHPKNPTARRGSDGQTGKQKLLRSESEIVHSKLEQRWTRQGESITLKRKASVILKIIDAEWERSGTDISIEENKADMAARVIEALQPPKKQRNVDEEVQESHCRPSQLVGGTNLLHGQMDCAFCRHSEQKTFFFCGHDSWARCCRRLPAVDLTSF